MSCAVEIEVDGPLNERAFFPPLQRAIRGNFDWNRLNEPMARLKAQHWPNVIPGQRIGLDAAGIGYVSEPLHDDEFAPVKEKIQKEFEQRLPPKLETFEDVHQPTWQYHLKALVESGIARVVSGKLPEKINGKPQLDLVIERRQSIEERMVNAIERQGEMLERQTRVFEQLIKTLADR